MCNSEDGLSILNLEAAKSRAPWTETTRSGFNLDDAATSVRNSVAPSADSSINLWLEMCIQDEPEIVKASQFPGQTFAIPLVQTVSVDQNTTETVSIQTDSCWRPTIKTEDHLQVKEITEKIRKNACKSIFKVLVEKHSLPKLQAQELAVSLEQQVNMSSPFHPNKSEYATNMRKMFTKLKVEVETNSSQEKVQHKYKKDYERGE